MKKSTKEEAKAQRDNILEGTHLPLYECVQPCAEQVIGVADADFAECWVARDGLPRLQELWQVLHMIPSRCFGQKSAVGTGLVVGDGHIIFFIFGPVVFSTFLADSI